MGILISAGTAAVLLVLWLILGRILGKFYIQSVVIGQSMEPCYKAGDRLILRAVNDRAPTVQRYDVALISGDGGMDGRGLLKRIVGLPGETVQIADGSVWIDGAPLSDDPGQPIRQPGIAEHPIQLGEDEYFVLGDNRATSYDSRAFGPVDRKRILYRVVRSVGRGKGHG